MIKLLQHRSGKNRKTSEYMQSHVNSDRIESHWRYHVENARRTACERYQPSLQSPVEKKPSIASIRNTWAQLGLDGQTAEREQKNQITTHLSVEILTALHGCFSDDVGVAFGPLRANVLHVYPLVLVVGLVRLLDTHSRGIHNLDEPLASGVRQLTMPDSFQHTSCSRARKDCQTNVTTLELGWKQPARKRIRPTSLSGRPR